METVYCGWRSYETPLLMSFFFFLKFGQNVKFWGEDLPSLFMFPTSFPHSLFLSPPAVAPLAHATPFFLPPRLIFDPPTLPPPPPPPPSPRATPPPPLPDFRPPALPPPPPPPPSLARVTPSPAPPSHDFRFWFSLNPSRRLYDSNFPPTTPKLCCGSSPKAFKFVLGFTCLNFEFPLRDI